jgi:hypothetical protein
MAGIDSRADADTLRKELQEWLQDDEVISVMCTLHTRTYQRVSHHDICMA